MNLKVLLVVPAFLMLFIMNCASPGEKLKKENPELYKDIVGKWYILSPTKPGEIIYTISFNEDGTVTGNFFKYKKTGWSGTVYTTNGYVTERGLFTVYDLDSDPRSYHSSGINIYYNSKKVIADFDQDSPYFRYIPLVGIMGMGDPITYYKKDELFVFVRDINTIEILKEKMANDNDNIDKENNYKFLISKLDKSFNKGKFGGGYQDYKWGMKESSIISLLGEPKTNSNSDDKNLSVLNYSLNDKDLQFTFYKEALFEIVVLLNGDDDIIFKSLKDKYGKPKVTTSHDTNYVGAWKSKNIYQDYNWSDGITNIRVRYEKSSTICENCDSKYSYTPHLQEGWVNGIVYQSNAIAKYIKEISDREGMEEKKKDEKKVKDNL